MVKKEIGGGLREDVDCSPFTVHRKEAIAAGTKSPPYIEIKSMGRAVFLPANDLWRVRAAIDAVLDIRYLCDYNGYIIYNGVRYGNYYCGCERS